MMIAVRHRGVALSNAGRVYALERLTAALARSAVYVRDARVSVADVNGPKGGEDKECTVTVHLLRGRPVTVTERAGSVTAAVDGASRRAGHAVGRLAARLRQLFGRGAR